MGIDNFTSIKLPDDLRTERAEKEEADLAKSKLNRFNKDTELRVSLANAFTVVIALWLLAVILILVGNTYNYKLSDSVLITLLTTTTIQVLGMMVIILWDLFPGGKDKSNPNNTDK